MRSVVALALLAASAAMARADSLPPASFQLLGGPQSGVGVDTKRLGAGYAVGWQAAWQPMKLEQRLGWGVRWTTLFTRSWEADAARIDDALRTVAMDFTLGVRIRPGAASRRYITVRGGVELLRSNQVIPPTTSRDFVGPTASVGFEWYFRTVALMSIDVRAGMISNGPEQVALTFSAGFTGP